MKTNPHRITGVLGKALSLVPTEWDIVPFNVVSQTTAALERRHLIEIRMAPGSTLLKQWRLALPKEKRA